MNKWLACCLVVLASGCPDIQTDENEGPGPVVEFDPGNKIVPFPNNLLLSPTGKVNIPPACNESASAKALREGVLNKLDGFGTYQTAMSVTLTEPIDMATTMGNIVMYKRAPVGGDSVDPATSMPIPVTVIPGKSVRFANQTANADGTLTCDDPGEVDSITIVPLVPLEQRSTYVVGILSGVKTASGQDYSPSSTWAIVRQGENPVTLDDNNRVVSERTPLDPSNPADVATLLGIDLLWKAHARGLAFLEAKQHARNNVLLAWEFNTQTVQDPLDPMVADSPAASLPNTPLVGVQSITCDKNATTCPNGIDRTAAPYVLCPAGDNNTQCFLKIALGSLSCTPTTCPTPPDLYNMGNAVCSQVGCAAVGDVVAAAMLGKSFQTERPNPFDATKPIPGPWSDPVKPMVVKEGPQNIIEVLAFIPAGAAPTAAGYNTVIFGHGLGSTKRSLFAIAPQMAASPGRFLTVAIDFVAHDSRAVRISDDAARGCADTGTPAVPPDPTTRPQCYAPFLSPDLGATRDNIRQSMLDVQTLGRALKACGNANCNDNVSGFIVDTAHISYAGLSLGGIMGSVASAMSAEIKTAVLNVPGAGWLDVLENTQTLAIKCSLVDGLIDAGIITGAKYDSKGTPDPSDDTGICVGDDWKAQPGYRQFSAIGRWVLDPADPANFMRRLAGTKRFLIQEVVGDTVVPNIATDRMALLGGLTTPGMADPYLPSPSPMSAPSAAITDMPMTNKFVKYMDLPADGGTGFPGNAFNHSSLLRPALGTAGQLGTGRIQTDAITYLVLNQ